MKKKFVFILSMMICLSSVTAYGTSIVSWYEGSSDIEEDVPADAPVEENAEYDFHLKEEKIKSPGFNGAVVGKTVIPEGWSIEVIDLSINSESITCPNAIWMTASSPDGKCKLSYISRREFKQEYTNAMGMEISSEDDKYSVSDMMHTLNYREAPEVCDLMASIIYECSPILEYQWTLSKEDKASIEEAKQNYNTSVIKDINNANQMYGMNLQLQGTDFTIATRTYSAGNKKITLRGFSSGFELFSDFSSYGYESYTDTIYWSMPAIYGLWTDEDVHESYQRIFDAFAAGTTISQEYEQMRNLNSQELQLAMLEAKNQAQQGSYSSSYGTESRYEDIEDTTIGSGDTYSAFDAWDDYIRGEEDYTTSDGTHIKLPSDYDHVYEGDNGIIYAGNSSDGPAGSTELNPTQIGDGY